MKLKELIPLLKISGLHDSIFNACIILKYDNIEKDLPKVTMGEYGRLCEREVVGISTYLPFTIWLGGEKE